MIFTHDYLVALGAKWLSKTVKCGFVVTELKAYTESGEVPDCIGFKGNGFSVLVECKTSRPDFTADKKKLFRQQPELGMGLYRFYLCPEGLLLPDELPDRWGLLYATKTGCVEQIICPKGNTWGCHPTNCFIEHNKNDEWNLMYSALRRIQRTLD